MLTSHADRVLQDELDWGYALGPGRHYVGPAQLVEEIVPHDADEAGGARCAQHDGGNPKVLQEVIRLCQAPGRLEVIGREEATHALIEVGVPDVHEDQSQQEVGDGEAAEPDDREGVVGQGVLAHGRVYAHWYGEGPRHQDREPCQGDRERNTVAYELLYGALARYGRSDRPAEIALQQLPHPVCVPLVLGAVKGQIGAQLGLLGPELSFVEVLGRIAAYPRDRIPRWQLQDDEGEDGDHPDDKNANNRRRVIYSSIAGTCLNLRTARPC